MQQDPGPADQDGITVADAEHGSKPWEQAVASSSSVDLTANKNTALSEPQAKPSLQGGQEQKAPSPKPDRSPSGNRSKADDKSHKRKKSGGVVAFLTLKEPSTKALQEFAEAEKERAKQKGAKSTVSGLPGVSSQKLPDHVPKVNSKWDGLPESATRKSIGSRGSEKSKRTSSSSGSRPSRKMSNSSTPRGLLEDKSQLLKIVRRDTSQAESRSMVSSDSGSVDNPAPCATTQSEDKQEDIPLEQKEDVPLDHQETIPVESRGDSPLDDSFEKQRRLDATSVPPQWSEELRKRMSQKPRMAPINTTTATAYSPTKAIKEPLLDAGFLEKIHPALQGDGSSSELNVTGLQGQGETIQERCVTPRSPTSPAPVNFSRPLRRQTQDSP